MKVGKCEMHVSAPLLKKDAFTIVLFCYVVKLLHFVVVVSGECI